MNKLQKPNDIFIATLSKPDATVADLLKNNITADNTSFLTMEEYMETPFVKKSKRYNENGVFKEDVFKQDYILAAQKFLELTDEKALDNIRKSLKYSPTSMQAPIESERYDPSATYSKIFNPRQQQVGIRDINYIEDPTKTNEELAQSHKIWDTKNNTWMDKTPETMSIFDKTFGQTLVYATYDEDTYDPKTGRIHRKGEWKTDENGEYYTETLEDRQLLDKQVVKLNDILTKENSAINKIDVFDSDGFEKSIGGTVTKTVFQIAPYLVPGLNKVYAGIVAASNMASIIPAFYKNIEAFFTGSADSDLSKKLTKAENWFHKFGNSKSYEGRNGFFNWESFGELTSDVFGQLYQQRAAASLSKLFLPEPKDASKLTSQQMMELIAKRNNLSKSLSLGYMALVTTADTYNDAKTAGFSDHAAAITSLLTSGALYKVMMLNSLNGLGTWFLDKSVGYDPSIEKKALKKIIKPYLDDAAKATQDLFENTNTKTKKSFIGAVKNFKNKVIDLINEGEGLWTNMFIEGTEEVTEEFTQDAIKGIMDTFSYMGLLKEKGSFGGFSNVFSQSGLQRYLATFLGGGVGGAMFHINNNYIEPFLTGKQIEKQDLEMMDLILNGQFDKAVELIKQQKPNFNNNISPIATNIDGKDLNLAETTGIKSQADAVIDGALKYVYAMKAAIESTIGPIDELQKKIDSYIPESVTGDLRENIKSQYARQQIDQNPEIKQKINDKFMEYVKKDFNDLVHNVVDTKRKIQSLESSEKEDNKNTEQLKNLKTLLKDQVEEVNDFFSGKSNYNKILQFLFLQDERMLGNFSAIDEQFSLDRESYVFNRYGVYYKDLPNALVEKDSSGKIIKIYNPRLLTKERVDQEFDEISKSKFQTYGKDLQLLVDLYNAEIREISPYFKQFSDKQLQKVLMQSISRFNNDYGTSKLLGDNTQDSYNAAADFLYNNLKFFDLNSPLKQDIAEELFNNNILQVAREENDEGKIKLIKNLFNNIASFWNRNQLWDKNILNKLVQYINEQLKNKNKNYYEINELLTTLETDTSDINIIFDSSNNQIEDIIEKLNSEKYKNILDSVKQQTKLSKDLYKSLEAYYENIKKELFEIVKNDYYSNGGDEEFLQYENEIKQGFEDLLNNSENPSEFTPIIYDILKDNELFKAYKNFIDSKNDLIALTEKTESNPIYEALKNIFRKVSYNNKQMDIFEYIVSKNLEIKNIKNNATLNLRKDEVKEVIDILRKSLYHLQSLLIGSTRQKFAYEGIEIDMPSFTDKIRDYIKNYTNDDIDSIYTIDHETAFNIQQILNELDDKLNLIQTVYGYNDTARLKTSTENEFKIKLKQLKFFKDIERIGEYTFKFDFSNVDFDWDDEEYDADRMAQINSMLYQCEKAFYETFQNNIILDSTFTEKFIDAFLEQFDKSYLNLYDVDSIIKSNNINYGFILQYLISISQIDPTIIKQKYIDGLNKNENIMYDYAQYLSFLINLSASYSEESLNAFQYLTQKSGELYNKMAKDNSDYLQRPVLSNIIYLGGSAGAGKTSVVGKFLADSLKEKELYISAPTQKKADDLSITLSDGSKKGVTVWKVNNENNLITQLYGEGNYNRLKQTKDHIEDYIHNKFLSELSKNEDGSYKNIELDVKETEYDGTKFKIHYKIKSNVIEILNLELELNPEIKPVNNSKPVLMIDEATLLDPFTSILLNNFSNTTNSVLYLIGDSFQNGYSIYLDKIKLNYNISKFFTIRSPYLDVMFRSDNTAITNNNEILKQQTKNWVAIYEDKSYRSAEEDTKQYFSQDQNYLKYKVTENELYGHELTNDKSKLIERLKLLSQLLNSSDKKLSILIPQDNFESTKQELEQLLKQNGITEDKYEIFIENDNDKAIQGSESEYVLLYNLKYLRHKENENVDVDIDLQSMYTYGSRSKKYTLIFEEDSNSGLYSHYKVNTIEDQDVYNEKVSSDILKTYTKDKIKHEQSLIDLNKSSFKKPSSTDSNKKEEEDDGDDKKEEEVIDPTEDVEVIEVLGQDNQSEQKTSELLDYLHKNNLMVLDGYHIQFGDGTISYELINVNNTEYIKIKGLDLSKNYDFSGYLKLRGDNTIKIYKNDSIEIININDHVNEDIIIEIGDYKNYIQFIEELNLHKDPTKKFEFSFNSLVKKQLDFIKLYITQYEGVQLIQKISNLKEYTEKQGITNVLQSVLKIGDQEFVFTTNSIRDLKIEKGTQYTLVDYTQFNPKQLQDIKSKLIDFKNKLHSEARKSSQPFEISISEDWGFVRSTNQRFYYFNPSKQYGYKSYSQDDLSMPLLDAEDLGYVFDYADQKVFSKDTKGFKDFLNWFNQFRYEKIDETSEEAQKLKTFYYNKIWVASYKKSSEKYIKNNPNYKYILGNPTALERKIIPDFKGGGKKFDTKFEFDLIKALYYKYKILPLKQKLNELYLDYEANESEIINLKEEIDNLRFYNQYKVVYQNSTETKHNYIDNIDQLKNDLLNIEEIKNNSVLKEFVEKFSNYRSKNKSKTITRKKVYTKDFTEKLYKEIKDDDFFRQYINQPIFKDDKISFNSSTKSEFRINVLSEAPRFIFGINIFEDIINSVQNEKAENNNNDDDIDLEEQIEELIPEIDDSITDRKLFEAIKKIYELIYNEKYNNSVKSKLKDKSFIYEMLEKYNNPTIKEFVDAYTNNNRLCN